MSAQHSRYSSLCFVIKWVGLTMPMHFFSMLHTLKLFLEIISAGRVFLEDMWIEWDKKKKRKKDFKSNKAVCDSLRKLQRAESRNVVTLTGHAHFRPFTCQQMWSCYNMHAHIQYIHEHVCGLIQFSELPPPTVTYLGPCFCCAACALASGSTVQWVKPGSLIRQKKRFKDPATCHLGPLESVINLHGHFPDLSTCQDHMMH